MRLQFLRGVYSTADTVDPVYFYNVGDTTPTSTYGGNVTICNRYGFTEPGQITTVAVPVLAGTASTTIHIYDRANAVAELHLEEFTYPARPEYGWEVFSLSAPVPVEARSLDFADPSQSAYEFCVTQKGIRPTDWQVWSQTPDPAVNGYWPFDAVVSSKTRTKNGLIIATGGWPGGADAYRYAFSGYRLNLTIAPVDGSGTFGYGVAPGFVPDSAL